MSIFEVWVRIMVHCLFQKQMWILDCLYNETTNFMPGVFKKFCHLFHRNGCSFFLDAGGRWLSSSSVFEFSRLGMYLRMTSFFNFRAYRNFRSWSQTSSTLFMRIQFKNLV